MAKSTQNGVEITAELASEVMKSRYKHGSEWQSYVYAQFQAAGIQPTFFKVNDGLSERIADYQYDGNWIEAKTFITDADVTKIIRLNEYLSKQSIRMIVLGEWDKKDKIGKKLTKQVSDLRKNGIVVYEGPSKCDSFIINEGVKLNPNKDIKMSAPIMVNFEQLIMHEDNRDTNMKNVPSIMKSIIENGFFTQLNVVKDKLENGIQYYKLFEGHTRYMALKHLKEAGYNIPAIMCVEVPWVTANDIDTLHKMLIKTNILYQAWKLPGFIKSNYGNLTKLNDIDGIFSYGKIKHSMNQAKKEGWGETTPVYVFSHIDSYDYDDMKPIKDGTYRISEEVYIAEIAPLLQLMTEIVDKGSNDRKYLGTCIREVLVGTRIAQNTNDFIKDNYSNFITYLKKKLVRDYDKGDFPDEKYLAVIYWQELLEDYIDINSK